MDDSNNYPVTREYAQIHGFTEFCFRIQTTHRDFLSWINEPLKDIREETKADETNGGTSSLILRTRQYPISYSPFLKYIFVDEMLVIPKENTDQPLVVELPAIEIHIDPTDQQLFVSIFHMGNGRENIVAGYAYVVRKVVERYPETKKSFKNQLKQFGEKNSEIFEWFGVARGSQYSMSLNGNSWKDNKRLIDWECSQCRARFKNSKKATLHIQQEHTQGTILPRLNAHGARLLNSAMTFGGYRFNGEPEALSYMGFHSLVVPPKLKLKPSLEATETYPIDPDDPRLLSATRSQKYRNIVALTNRGLMPAAIADALNEERVQVNTDKNRIKKKPRLSTLLNPNPPNNQN